jgi:hypothetical protein
MELLPVAAASFVALAVPAALLHRRMRCPRARLNVGRAVAMAVCIQLLLVFPVAVASGELFRWQHPEDDWYDIAGFGAGGLQVILTPFVGLVVWCYGRRWEGTPLHPA